MNNKETNNNGKRGIGLYRPKLSFFHPNAKGTGSAVKMEMHPAHDDTDGCIMVNIAKQMSIGSRDGQTTVFARFDWDHAICVKLDFSDLCRILQVLRGECESIDDGRGLYHRSASASTRIVFRHMLEPIAGYSLELYRVPVDGRGEDVNARMIFSPSEATGLCDAISGSMAVISFGIPMLISRAGQNGQAVQKGGDDDVAA